MDDNKKLVFNKEDLPAWIAFLQEAQTNGTDAETDSGLADDGSGDPVNPPPPPIPPTS